jgi:hypothetical protein
MRLVTRTISLLMPLLLLCATTGHAAQTPPDVRYDKQRDTLSFAVEETSLKLLLTHIAMQSGIEVLFDERADRPVTVTFDQRPLPDALKNLLIGSSSVLRYERGDADQLLLIGVKVLPEGTTDGNAQPLLHAAGEAFMHERDNRMLSAEEQEKKNLANERWQARLKEMPPAVREKVEQHAKERLDTLEQKSAERKASSAEKKAKREADKAERKAKREQEFEALSPEEQALVEQRRSEARARFLNNQNQQ